MSKPIYLVGGSKGGVGKSIVSMALIDYLQQRNEPLLIVESDTSNPDVYKTYNQDIQCELIDLDVSDGWIELVNTCDSHSNSTVIINTAARNNKGVKNYGDTLNSTLKELKRRLITLWVINRQRDSLELLRDYLDCITQSDSHNLHVLCNGYFGEASKFELYNASKIKTQIESGGGKTLHFPDLADRVSDDIYSKRLTISKALSELPIGNRAELTRWRNVVKSTLTEIIP